MSAGAPSVRLTPASAADRDDAAAFAGRVARWDPAGPVRLRVDGQRPGVVRLWGTTPFDTLVMRAVRAELEPRDATVRAGNLLAALAVDTADTVDPGPTIDATWRAQLPPPDGWIAVDDVPAAVLADLAEQGTAQARTSQGPAGGASTALLDSEVLTVSGNGMRVAIALRVLFALSGMGFSATEGTDGTDDPASSGRELVRVRATDSWLRLDARYGSVLRRRHSLLPLLF